MIIIVPIYFEKNENFWFSPDGLKHIKEFLLAASEFPVPVFVCSDQPHILDVAQRVGLATKSIAGELKDGTNYPPGYESCFAEFRKSHFGMDILAVGFRMPFLIESTMTTVLEKFRGSDKPFFAGLRAPEDHPCQYHRFFGLAEVGVVSIVDHDFSLPAGDKSWTGTRPFDHEWEADVPDGGIFDKVLSPYGSQLEPIFGLASCESGMWYRENSGKARIIISSNEDTDVYIWPAGSSLHDVRIKRHEEGFVVSVKSGQTSSSFRFWWKTFGDEQGESLSARVDIHSGGTTECFIPDMGQAGMVYQVFKEEADGAYDVFELYIPEGALWQLDAQGARLTNEKGQSIFGRQAFPEAWVTELNLFAVKGETKLSLPDQMECEQTSFHEFDESSGNVIHTEMDLIQRTLQG